ncbi:ATP-binding protein, partial [Kitasatospora sp. NPDC059088]|uniref:ATP-binding protein n=1 Tax=Kitasatospora sp. NPDC059088 TaxID=3346722 RepID=UPI003697990A
MDIWWTLHLKRDPASVPLARRILLGAMATAGVDPQIADDLGVALTEACANAVEHGATGRPDDGFQVTAAINGDRLRIEVTDSGPGLPAPSAPPARRPAAPAPAGHAPRPPPRGRAPRAGPRRTAPPPPPPRPPHPPPHPPPPPPG